MTTDELRDYYFQKVFSKLSIFTILYEDSEIEERFFNVDENSTVLSISAAGCGVASLLAKRPTRIDAVDINPHHLALTALKATAVVQVKSYSEFYQLFGHGFYENSERLIGKLCKSLPSWIQAYWKKNHRVFQRGLYDQGLTRMIARNISRILKIDRNWIQTLAKLTPEQRTKLIDRTAGPVLRHPLMTWIFNSPLPLFAAGVNYHQKKVAQKTLNTRSMSEILLHQFKAISCTDVLTNWVGWHILIGQFNHSIQNGIPPYLRRKNHQSSWRAPTQIAFHSQPILKVLENSGKDGWSHFNLSDVPDWLPEAAQKRLFKAILKKAKPGAYMIYRTVQGSSLIKQHRLTSHFKILEPASSLATDSERSKLFKRVNIYQISL